MGKEFSFFLARRRPSQNRIGPSVGSSGQREGGSTRTRTDGGVYMLRVRLVSGALCIGV